MHYLTLVVFCSDHKKVWLPIQRPWSVCYSKASCGSAMKRKCLLIWSLIQQDELRLSLPGSTGKSSTGFLGPNSMPVRVWQEKGHRLTAVDSLVHLVLIFKCLPLAYGHKNDIMVKELLSQKCQLMWSYLSLSHDIFLCVCNYHPYPDCPTYAFLLCHYLFMQERFPQGVSWNTL